MASLGDRLLAELHCTACHEAKGAVAERIGQSVASDLSLSNQRLRSDFLLSHLADPHDVDPTSRMPDLLVGKSSDDRIQIARALLSFLSEGTQIEAQQAQLARGSFERGKEVFYTVGCIACHQVPLSDDKPGFKDSLAPSSGISVDGVRSKYLFGGVVRFLEDRKSGHGRGSAPALQLEESEAIDVATYLAGGAVGGDGKSFEPDLQLISDGRRYFDSFHCGQCHGERDSGKARTNPVSAAQSIQALENLDGGCLSEIPSPGIPHYRLSSTQRKAILVAINRIKDGGGLTLEQEIDHELMGNRCYACHSRDGMGGPKGEMHSFFRSTESDLGDEGRLPPHLTGVGRKLKRSAMEQVISGRMASRPYMLTRMPAFNHDLSVRLANYFSIADISSDEVPTVREHAENQVGRNMWGRALIGSKGLGCITCHRLGGNPSLGIQAIDLAHAPRRLRPEWFRDYLIDPAKFRPGTRMPAFWPDGQPSLSGFGGATTRQIDSLWAYLSELDQSRLPDGIENTEDFLLHPGKRPLVFRTFLKGVGNHAIAVGFDSGTHIAFDSLHLRWAIAWSGDFLSAESTWDDRFTPLADPEGAELISIQSLEPRFDSVTGFRGYRLDPTSGVPEFDYTVAGVRIMDAMQPVGSESRHLRRRLSLKEAIVDGLWLDIASGRDVESLPSVWLVVGELRIETAAPVRVVSDKDGARVQVQFAGADPVKTIFIDYRW
jgi:cytochrome c2